MTCPECGWPKRPNEAETCWRRDAAQLCRRLPEPEPPKSEHGVPVKLRRHKSQIASNGA